MNDWKARTIKTVYFLGGDGQMNNAVANRLAAHGVPVWELASVDALLSAEEREGAIILVLDGSAVPPGQDVAGVLETLGGRLGEHPDLVCVGGPRDMALRLQALRAGAVAFHAYPLVADELAAWLLERSGVGPSDPYRVLVVDDQPVAAMFAVRVLESAGMRARAVGDPLALLDGLDELRPDLVLMDLHMPGASGLELTSIIREHDQYYGLPVLFLSREADMAKQLDAMRVGADDFIAKPVDPELLIATVKERIQASRALRDRRMARFDLDPVSGLYDRTFFLKRLGNAVSDPSFGEPGNGVLCIELDAPEAILERIGRACADTLVAMVGRLIRERMRPTDTAARLDEHGFGLLVRRADDPALLELAEGLRAAAADQTEVGGTAARVTLSIGVGLFRPPADDGLTVLSRARKACGKARLAGGDRVESYVPLVPADGGPERDSRLALLVEESFGGGLELLYQPIVALRNVPGQRYEAALRLRAPDGEYIPPFDFLPVARDRGLMLKVDRWVMERALDELGLQRERYRDLRFFVHQTMETLSAEHWALWLRDQIARRELIKMRPVLQFQFRDVAEHFDLAVERFGELARLGIKVCLLQIEDDAEAMRLVESLPISLVKLSFRMLEDIDPQRLTNLVRRMHGHKIAVIAAGIESPRTITELWGCGVDFIQGNFLQLPAEELTFDFSEAALT